MTVKEKFLGRWAGALLLASALFALAALLAFGSQGRYSDWGWGFTFLGFVCLTGWFFGRRGQAKIEGDQYSRQRTVLGLNAIISVLLLLVLLVGVNYIAARRHKIFDLTKNRINSLAPQTTKAISELKTPVKMTYVWAPNQYAPLMDPLAQSVLEAYRGTSDKVEVEFVNAVQDPMKLQAMGLINFSGQPILVIEKSAAKSGDATTPAAPSDRQQVSVVDEQNITSAILKLNNPTPRVLYLLTGHGEQVLSGTGNVAMSAARNALESQNYTLKILALTGAQAKIPADAAAILVLGPQVDLSASEAQKLQAYLNGKGRLALFFQLPRRVMPRWKSLARSLNVELGEGQVLELDPQKSGGNPQIIAGIVDEPSRHPILRSVSGAVLFPGVFPMRVVAAPTNSGALGAAPNATTLFETSINSNSLTGDGRRLQQTGTGPFAVAVAIEKASAPPSVTGAPPARNDGLRAVIVANASFAADSTFNELGNGSFFLGATNWVVGNDALVTIPPKEPITNSITMTDATRNFAALFSLVALPLGVLLLGTAVWWKRR